MSDLEAKIDEYYNGYDEENRLIKDNSHSVEFLTTTKYLDKYITNKDKILELGAATGRYSFYYADKGCKVSALELSKKHIKIMKSKLVEKSLDIEVVEGNALNLSQFQNETYDAVLCLGPFYHLTKQQDRNRCINECLKVLKPGGIVAIAYINRFAHFVNWINRDKENINDIGLFNISKTGCEYGDSKDCFYFSSCEEIEELMSGLTTEVAHISADGISDILRKRVNEFTNEEFDRWLEYHFDTCENKSMIGYSQHCLYIGKKP